MTKNILADLLAAFASTTVGFGVTYLVLVAFIPPPYTVNLVYWLGGFLGIASGLTIFTWALRANL